MQAKHWWYYLIIIFVAYLVGSINFAKIISALKKKDISKEGSGNPGTMNMLRSVGIGMGLLTLFLDILKGVLVALMGLLMAGDLGLYAGGLMCIIGHNYSIFLKGKGGKGVASCIGVFAVANPIATLIGFVLLLAYLFTFKYGSIGSFLFLIGLSLTESIIHRHSPEIVLVIVLLAVLIMFAHRGNISRLIHGKENKLELIKYIKKAKEKKRAKLDTAQAETVAGANEGNQEVLKNNDGATSDDTQNSNSLNKEDGKNTN